jgi:nucleoside 2-deoxyribosyltransferase
MKKEKIYIAGKISNNPNYKEQFQEAEDLLIKLGYEVFNPAKIELNCPSDCICDKNKEWGCYMLRCFPELHKCDGVCLLPNYRDSTGARIEFQFSLKTGKGINSYEFFKSIVRWEK